MAPGLSPAAIALVFALLLLPGFGITFAIQPPGAAPLPVRTGLAFAFGYATIALTSLGLALMHVLRPGVFLGSAGLITVVVWALALRRVREHLRALRDDIAGQWIRYVTLLGVLAGTIVVRTTYVPIVNFVPTTLRYWADGVEIADAHAIPSTTLQWGHLLQPTVSKVALNTFNATMSLFLGREPLGSAGALLFVVSIGLVFLGYALAEELGIRWLAPLVPLLLFLNERIGNTELTSDLHQNLAEDWGRLAVLGALVLAVRALKPGAEPGEPGTEEASRSRSSAVREGMLAGAMFGVAAGTHLIPTAAGLAFAGGYAIMRMVVDHGVVRVLRTSAAALAIAAVVGAAVLVLPKGDLGFKGAQGKAAYEKMIHDLGLPATFDPTEFLVFGTVEAASRPYPYSPGHVLPDFTYQVLHQNASNESTQRLPLAKALLPSALALLGVVILMVFGGADLRAMAGTAVIFTLVLIGVSLAFAARYHLYALETFGNRRLFNYVPIPFVLVAAGVGELGLRWLGRRAGGDGPRTWIPPVVAGVMAVAIAVVLLPSTRAPGIRLRAGPNLELVNWVGQHDPCQGYILTDRRTLASFEATVGRAAVLEGMGPHVRPDVLELAIGEMFRAGDFFRDPENGLSYLRARGVAYVVTTNEFVLVHSLGGWRRVGPSDPLQLAKVPFLQAVFANNAGTVYRVAGFAPSPSMPDPSKQPGFCRT